MKAEVLPSLLTGRVSVPGSKSDAQRIVACALMARGVTTIHAFPDNDDCLAALQVAQDLGAVVTRRGSTVEMRGGFPQSFASGIRNPKSAIDCGESGLASRMFASIAALSDMPIEVTGRTTLMQRPFDDLILPLQQCGASVVSSNGRLPLQVCGPLRGGVVEINAAISSQFLTGLLIALSRANEPSIVRVHNLKSKPYIALTLQILAHFGVDIKHNESLDEFRIVPKAMTGIEISVPGDWSGAAFLLVAAALCAEQGMVVDNLAMDSAQADRAIISALQAAGVRMEIAPQEVKVWQSEIRAFDFDATDCPDLFPPLVALAAFADGPSVILGASRLIHKESNRAKVLQQEFAKANIRIVIRGDEMKVYPSAVRRAEINSHHDHRIAMAAAVLGLAGDHVTIRNSEAISKSFPSFFELLISLKGRIQVGA